MLKPFVLVPHRRRRRASARAFLDWLLTGAPQVCDECATPGRHRGWGASPEGQGLSGNLQDIPPPPTWEVASEPRPLRLARAGVVPGVASAAAA